VSLFIRKLKQTESDIRKFVLVTRGRTGSTAIIDELNQVPHFQVLQELFILGEYSGSPEQRGLDGDYYSAAIPPFDHWKQPHVWWDRWLPHCCRDVRQAHLYLIYAESQAKLTGAQIFGWKLLSSQFWERPYILKLLQKHNYSSLYLKRSLAAQVLSGLVANSRNIFNSREEVVDTSFYSFDIDAFKRNVLTEKDCVNRDLARLLAAKFDFLAVDYETFCNDRQAFYLPIFKFLGIQSEIPRQSGFQRIIKETRKMILNYDELALAAAEIGEVL
jgi:hypothetical protein